jgi:hexokinase
MCSILSLISQNVPAELHMLVSNTTRTLIASWYVNLNMRIALIFGTGCNATYMERVGGIHKIKNLGIDNKAKMAIYDWVCRCPHRH